MPPVTEDWDSSNQPKKEFVSKDWDSSEIKRRTAGDRIREQTSKIKQQIGEARQRAKERRAYEKSPEGKAAKIKTMRQEYALESARYKLSKVKSQRRQQQIKSLGLNGSNLGNDLMGSKLMGGGGAVKMPTSGFDSMFGFGGGEKQSRSIKQKKSGLDEMFGF